MRKTVLRIITLCLVLALCAPAGAESVAGVTYTVGEKLAKQLEAGSGFTGTLTLEAVATPGRESEAIVTLKPVVLDVGYIHVREDLAAKTPAESRVTLALKDGDATAATAQLAVKQGMAYVLSSLTGDGWLSLAGSTAATDTPAGAGALAQATAGLLADTAMPGIAAFAAGLMSQLNSADTAKLATALEPYATKIDVWIEGFRQNALLGKAEDGTTTMRVDYTIPAAAIKAQLKQLVLDMLADEALLPRLAALLPEGGAETYLNPALQSYYFYAIDELPLNGDMTISRTVSLRGETLMLALAMPLYDTKGGAIALRYDRSKGAGDLPDENSIELSSEKLLLRADYQTYDTLTGTVVYQGKLLRQPLGATAFEVGTEGTAAGEAAKTISAAFTLSVQQGQTTDTEGKDTQTAAIELSLEPEYTPDAADDAPAEPTEAQKALYVTFPPLAISLTAAFASGQAKNAATSADVQLKVAGDTLPQAFTLTLSGKTRGKWTPDAFDAQAATSLDAMNETAMNALLMQAGVRGGLLLLPYVTLPTPTAAP